MNAILLSAVWGVMMMFLGAFVKNRAVPRYAALAGAALLFAASAAELLLRKPLVALPVADMLVTDAFNLTFLTLIMGLALFFLLFSSHKVVEVGPHAGEYFALVFFVLCGIALTATYANLLMLFLGIEIMSIPLYILTASDKRNLKSNEAALKYFLMGAFSTGILLMGIAFLYGGNPQASFHIDRLGIGSGFMPVLVAVGLLFLLVALSFKVSAAPFHFWTPDVYDGAPTVFTSFMSTLVKAAGFFAFLRLFEHSFGLVQDQWQRLIAGILVLTLLIGNITAVFQQSVKRMLAYSSIAQAGFMLFAVFALNARAKEGLLLYSAAYSVATIGLFAVLMQLEDYTVDGFNGLAKRQPLLALTATVCLLSLTGVPLTAGFQSKFFMLMSAMENGAGTWVVLVALFFAAVSAYYYFRVIQAMYFRDSGHAPSPVHPFGSGFRFMLVLTIVLILVIGVYPEIVIGWMHRK